MALVLSGLLALSCGALVVLWGTGVDVSWFGPASPRHVASSKAERLLPVVVIRCPGVWSLQSSFVALYLAPLYWPLMPQGFLVAVVYEDKF